MVRDVRFDGGFGGQVFHRMSVGCSAQRGAIAESATVQSSLIKDNPRSWSIRDGLKTIWLIPSQVNQGRIGAAHRALGRDS